MLRVGLILTSIALLASSHGCNECSDCQGTGSTSAGSSGGSSSASATSEASSTGEASSTSTGVDPTLATSGPSTGSSSGSGSSGGVDCAIHVGLSGADMDGCGSLEAPCRTITRGLTLADPACGVTVGPGVFDAAGGEVFPLVLDGVRVVGSGADPDADPTIIDHSGGPTLPTTTFPCPVGQPNEHSAPVVLVGADPEVRRLIVKAPVQQTMEVAVLVDGAVGASLRELWIEGGAEGVFIAGGSAQIEKVTVTRAGHAAVKPAGTSTVEVIASTFFGNKDAVEPICDATTLIRDSEAYCNGNGLEALASADTTMENNYVHHNNVGIGGRGADITMTLRGNTIEANQIGALAWFGTIDLGTTSEPGGNTFRDNVIAGLEIIRIPGDTGAIGNTWEPGVDGADATGAYSGPVTFDAPQCPATGLMNLDVPPPPTCKGDEPSAPGMGYRNVAIEDGSCFAGMPSPTGSVVVSE